MAESASEVHRLRALLSAAPQDSNLMVDLVSALLDLGEQAEATRTFEAFALDSKASLAYYEVGARLYASTGHHIQAARFRRHLRDIQITAASDPTRHPSRSSQKGPSKAEPRRHLQVVKDELGTAGPAVALSRPTETMADIVGLAKVKSILADVIAGVRTTEGSGPWSGGALLYGPPSCGKQFAARVLAGELGAQLWSVNLAAASSVTSVLQDLKPALDPKSPEHQVIFLEHVDAAPGHVDQHAGALLTSLVPFLDGAPDQVVVIGSATYPWMASPLVVRPGRLSTVLLVLPPDRPARRTFLAQRLSNAPRAAREEIEWLLDHTDGYTFGDLDDLLAVAARMAEGGSDLMYRDISHAALRKARQTASPTSAEWLTIAGHHAIMNEQGGLYDDLLEYFDQREKPTPSS